MAVEKASTKNNELVSNQFTSILPLVEFIKSIYPINQAVEDFILRNSFRRKVMRGKFLLKPGDMCTKYYFIHKGILRAYIKHGNKEITTWINPELEITTSIRSMSRQEPSREYIQAIEDCELIEMEFEAMFYLYEQFPEMNTVGRKLLEEYYAGAEERAFVSRIPNAETRYHHFVESRPELINRIPMKYIASYLGMTVETLSRLRSKKKTAKADNKK